MNHLFSYGTLQQENVQLVTFGHVLTGKADALLGYKQEMLAITDPQVLKESGRSYHPIVSKSENNDDRVTGTVFELTNEELNRADVYEVEDYTRVRVTLASGKEAWLYQKSDQ